MRTYLVTGGAGFIGSHVATALVERGDKVRVLDNLCTGHRKNVEHIATSIEFIEGEPVVTVETDFDDGHDDDDDGFSDDTAMVMSLKNAMDCIGCGSCARICPKGCFTHEAQPVAA